MRNYDFPDRCCIKPTHASGKVIIRKHGEPIDYEKIVSWLSFDYYPMNHERNYKNLERKIIVEPLLFDEDKPTNFNFYCYRGVPRIIVASIGGGADLEIKTFSRAWADPGFSIIPGKPELKMEAPAKLEEMLDVAHKLSAFFSHVRIDLYSDGNSVLAGEITNCSYAATAKFSAPDGEDAFSEALFSTQ